MNEDTEFDVTPVDEVIQNIETMIGQLDVAEPSSEAVAEIRDLITQTANQLGNIDGDEDAVNAGSDDRLAELKEKLDEICPN
ncbi:hypothetical protein CO057_04245 [Candidatus Uhrbacteria bacterium CG_4_9_14_0_2_um_filter_41_50]|uniref:Uncharacterized protein n=1 Tax=Candidatus Uhrbacteria bacterium CG_4_9_14_0_2_um_filter_41_50 TaxID=1975031 RepID=A0A2M8EN71_9BACT|nr:MAG: hypothetical protein COZ45_03475 [Candidatus Uhrbacteria bacterium CG_4_10_14_3_um_filter_41_21]PIZ55045.1 MAG: hypothetical protein COY24_01890 [Candidatus Uhrbacteria bacterium CG_4_10_14_0_2_um_filter_41_21]PJB84314.1 MAG: hypothetical protein CO086_04280 [Candidatus Uhrbacteria bacterium CG_4_9_14_0_8_um_filter_41_16]PJC24179.1 MAG: hypothetical protein CO057_04245 [Candidatus Uhrbacteria bacterium CG_4_9_14_0_2_um_filter_41_50]PJE75176.1 MAG: hypothetical protein COV03_01570 [Candi